MPRPIEIQVREMCLVCQGEGWIPEALEPERSKPCLYCGQSGWVEIRTVKAQDPEDPQTETSKNT